MADPNRVENILQAMEQRGERYVHIRDGKDEYVGLNDTGEWKFGRLGERETVGTDDRGRAKVAEAVAELIDRGAEFTAKDNYDYGKGRIPPRKL